MNPFLFERLAIVDLETTGTAAVSDAITEIGIVLVDKGVVVEEWTTLVNPGTTIPPEIQALTGITDAMVRNAPGFGEIAEEVRSRLQGCLLVAHNARFDYGFLKNAFRRLGLPFAAEVLCSVRLSRRLYPRHHQHGLDALIARHGLVAEGRHRALGDARFVWQFLQLVQREHPAESVTAAVKSLLKMPSMPPQLDPDALGQLPDGPGVYVFYGVNDMPIYIGKSVNLKDRVRSHFSSDHRNSNDLRLSMEIRRIAFEETAGELGALLRESQLVKTSKPLRNLRLRRNAAMVFVRLDDPAKPFEIVGFHDADLEQATGLFGPFATKARAKALLTSLAADHGLCWKALQSQSIDGPCFARQIRRCQGYCVGAETLTAHNARLVAALADWAFPPWPFAGAIAVRETHPEHGWQRAHVFHRWRYLGSGKDEAEVFALAETAGEVEFDADIFKLILKRVREGDSGIIRLAQRSTESH